MPSTITDVAGQLWKDRQGPSWQILDRPLKRLRNSQLHEGSFYARLRAFLPFVWLGSLWFSRLHGAGSLDTRAVMAHSETVRHAVIACSVLAVWNLWLTFQPFERTSPRRDVAAECTRLFSASAACGFFLLVCDIAGPNFAHRIAFSATAMLELLLSSGVLLGLFMLRLVLAAHPQRGRAALIVGTGRRAELLRRALQGQEPSVRLFGYVDDQDLGTAGAEQPYLGPIDGLAEILKQNPIEVVYIGLPMRSKYDEIQRVVAICETIGVELHYLREIFDTTIARVQAQSLVTRDFNVVSTQVPHPKQWIKRGLDLVCALVLLLLLSPVLLAASLAVALSSPGPVLFRQQRYGLHRRQFGMYKFRSMVVDAEHQQAALEGRNEAQGPVFKLRRDPRVTRVGALLRRSSIDELPQLFNVLRGEMSLVGPRPLPLRDVSRFEEAWLLRRFSVRPGLTCIWQVNGRSDTSFDEWIRQDLEYIDRWSLLLDLRILLSTIPAVLRGSGAA